MSQYLFIYGTLLPDIAPEEISDAVKKLKFLGKGFVYGKLYNLGEYPAAILDNSSKVYKRIYKFPKLLAVRSKRRINLRSKIFGQIYKLPSDENILQKLDEYEGYYPQDISKSLYVRKQVKVYLANKYLTCWIYEYNRDIANAPRIESGKFSAIHLK